MRNIALAVEFIIVFASIVATALIDFGQPDGWPFGALAGAAFGAFLVISKRSRSQAGISKGFNARQRRAGWPLGTAAGKS